MAPPCGKLHRRDRTANNPKTDNCDQTDGISDDWGILSSEEVMVWFGLKTFIPMTCA